MILGYNYHDYMYIGSYRTVIVKLKYIGENLNTRYYRIRDTIIPYYILYRYNN